MNRFSSLGVITGKAIPDKGKIATLFEKLDTAFSSEGIPADKEKIVNILHEYLPNFEHIETGRSLDSKM